MRSLSSTVVREESGPDLVARSLGHVVEGESGTVRHLVERFGKLQAALRWLVSMLKVYGWRFEKLLGHLIHVLLWRRPLMACLRSLHDFSSRLMQVDLRAPWCDAISISDASLSGWAAGSARVGREAARTLGRCPERMRYRIKEPFEATRVRAQRKLSQT